MSNWKTTLSGALSASGLAGFCGLLAAGADIKHAALALGATLLGNFAHGFFAMDKTK